MKLVDDAGELLVTLGPADPRAESFHQNEKSLGLGNILARQRRLGDEVSAPVLGKDRLKTKPQPPCSPLADHSESVAQPSP